MATVMRKMRLGPPDGETVLYTPRAATASKFDEGNGYRTASTAALASMRRKDNPFLASMTVTPVFLRAASSASGLRPGWAESIRAATPAATGQACDVPTKVDTPPPMPAEVTGAPGASTSTLLSLFE